MKAEDKDKVSDLLFRRKYLELIATEQLRLDQAIHYIEQAGKKEVVDWVEIVDTVELDGAKQYTITLEQWQAKMKDWGL